MQKDGYFPDQPAGWVTPALANVVNGLTLEGKAKHRFPNFIDSSVAVSIIKHESTNSEFAQLEYLSFLLALRVPSGALSLVRA